LIRLCLDIVLQVCSFSPSRREPFLRSAPLGQGAVLDRWVIASTKMYFILYLSAENTVIEFKTQFVIKFNF
jgi:hypothetical protein